MLNMQGMLDMMSEVGERARSNYHLTLGGCLKALESAIAKNPDIVMAKTIVDHGSYRGYYSDL